VIGVAGIITLNAIYRGSLPPDAAVPALIVTALATGVPGILSLSAFALRGVIQRRWRFSLAGLLIAMTVMAATLGIVVYELKR
jgi:hypothetical protein